MSVESGKYCFPSQYRFVFLINLGSPFFVGINKDDCNPFTGCISLGYLSRHLICIVTTPSKGILVIFNSGMEAPFVPVPSVDLTDTVVSIEDLWNSFGDEFISRIYEAKNLTEIVQILDSVFIKRLIKFDYKENKINQAVNTILINSGWITIEELSQAIGLSRRQLERRFKNEVGLTPKRLCRIARLEQIINKLKYYNLLDWSEIALENGFSDQAHLINEWKYFTGSSPLSYLNQVSDMESVIIGL